MNDDKLDGWKQSILATVSQSEDRVRTDLGTEIKSGLLKVQADLTVFRGEMKIGFAGVGNAIDALGDQLDCDKDITDHQLKVVH